MRNLIKSKKKKGFTLIEMVAVVAIIGILAAILVPKITGYMKEAKKTGVIDQARKITQAYETAEMKGKLKATDMTSATPKPTVNGITNETMLSLLDVPTDKLATEFAKLNNANIEDCFDIVEGGEFTVNSNGIYQKDVEDVSSK